MTGELLARVTIAHVVIDVCREPGRSYLEVRRFERKIRVTADIATLDRVIGALQRARELLIKAGAS